MARVINTGEHEARRGQLTRVHPDGIIYDPTLNTGRPLDLERRAGPGWEEEAYKDLLESIRANPHNWQQGCPGVCERLPDGTVRLRAGFRRYEALRYENTLRAERGEEPLSYAFTFADGTPLDLVRLNINENVRRKNLSPIGEARLLQTLIKEHKLTQAEAAAVFLDEEGNPRRQAWVSERLLLLRLRKDLQQKVHTGELGLAAALQVVRLTDEARAQVLERGDLSLRAIRAATEGVKPRVRTMPEARRVLREEAETAPTARMRTLALEFQRFLSEEVPLSEVARALESVFTQQAAQEAV
jgi:hypothetical protein